jgi:hypothetical protein
VSIVRGKYCLSHELRSQDKSSQSIWLEVSEVVPCGGGSQYQVLRLGCLQAIYTSSNRPTMESLTTWIDIIGKEFRYPRFRSAPLSDVIIIFPERKLRMDKTSVCILILPIPSLSRRLLLQCGIPGKGHTHAQQGTR